MYLTTDRQGRKDKGKEREGNAVLYCNSDEFPPLCYDVMYQCTHDNKVLVVGTGTFSLSLREGVDNREFTNNTVVVVRHQSETRLPPLCYDVMYQCTHDKKKYYYGTPPLFPQLVTPRWQQAHFEASALEGFDSPPASQPNSTP